MKENEFYHGPIFPEMMGSIKNQFQIGDIVEISDLRERQKDNTKSSR